MILGQIADMESKLFFEAIALRKCVRATYNRMDVTLAPHILYTRHDDLFVDAVTVERDGRVPKQAKLGTFKLIGLKDVALADRRFEIECLFEPAEAKYDGVTLFAVENQHRAA